jgi:hypothetical protein
VIAEAATVATLRLSVAPQRLLLRPKESAVLTVRAPAGGVDVAVGLAGLTLDARGRPRVEDRVPTWLEVRPRRFTLGARGTASLRVAAAAVPATAAAGDHSFVVLLAVTDRAQRASRILARVGIVVAVRVPGVLRRRVEVVRASIIRTGRRRLRVLIANTGNVDAWLPRGRVSVTLMRRGSPLAVLRSAARRLLAHGRGIIEWAMPASAGGADTAQVLLARRLAYRLRL